MIFLSFVEFLFLPDHGCDGLVESFLGDFFGTLGDFLLLVRVIEDGGGILGTTVSTLATRVGRVVCFPEPFQDGFGRDDVRIVDHLNHFDMPGGLTADLFVGRIGNVASHESRGDRGDSLELLENGFGAPVAASAESDGFAFFRHDFLVGFDLTFLRAAIAGGQGEGGEDE